VILQDLSAKTIIVVVFVAVVYRKKLIDKILLNSNGGVALTAVNGRIVLNRTVEELVISFLQYVSFRC